MEASDVIAFTAILAGAGTTVASLWYGNRQAAEERKQRRADARMERAIDALGNARGLFQRMNPGSLLFRKVIDSDQVDEVERDLEWLSFMGWNEEIRDLADLSLDTFYQAFAFHISLDVTDDEERNEEHKRELGEAVKKGSKLIDDLSQAVKRSTTSR